MINENNAAGDFITASADFNKARNKALLSKITHITNTDGDDLLSFYDVKEIIKPKGEFYRGMEQVPLDLIVGSEGRYRDFNRFFLPRSEVTRYRWESVDRAQLGAVNLPPVQLYEIGGVYFVRDGNHRVSVAKSQNGVMIDAEVTSLNSEITITPSMTTADLRKTLIEYEKKSFCDKTRYNSITGDNALDFSIPGRYDIIFNHIQGHRYFLNNNKETEISPDEALVSWYNNIYAPIIKVITENNICHNFPGKTKSDLYIYIVKHWDFLKRKNGLNYPARDAAKDYTRKYGKKTGLISGIIEFIANLFRKKNPKTDKTE